MPCAILACFHALILARRNLLAIVCEVINLRKLILKLHSIVCFSLCIFVKCHSSNCGGGGGEGGRLHVTQMQPNMVHAEQAVAN